MSGGGAGRNAEMGFERSAVETNQKGRATS